MNIMRFLTPKSNVAYLDSLATVRNGFEKMTFPEKQQEELDM